MDSALPEDARPHRLAESNGSAVDPWDESRLPADMVFNESNVVSIVVHAALFVLGSAGNFTVLAMLMRKSTPRTRINTMLVHLAIADLLVILLVMPLEIGWAWTVSWKAGDVACRALMFLRVFGIYLSTFVLVCISVDRYVAVLKPLRVRRRCRTWLAWAWAAAFACSCPQSYMFHVEPHKHVRTFLQCVAKHRLPNEAWELAYSLVATLMMYLLPLAAFVFCYTSIVCEIVRRGRNADEMRRSSDGFLGRARVRTLKMTLTIVFVFVVCWTPYYIMAMWFWFDRPSAELVDLRVRRALFVFAYTNSCMNPVVYGLYNVRARGTPGQDGSAGVTVSLRTI